MSSSPGFFRRHLTAILWILTLFIIACAFSVPSADMLRQGRHKPVQLYRTISSDGSQEVTTSSRVAMPVFSVTDPAMIVTFNLRDISSGKILASQEVKMEKESALGNPLVMWSEDGVRVSAFDAHQERSVTLQPSGATSE